MTIQQSSLRGRLARGTSLSSEKELRAILVLVTAFFFAFLALPAALVLIRSLTGADGGASLANYAATLADPDFLTSIANSLTVSCASALVATGLAFLLSYTVNCTNAPASLKRAIDLLAQLPMLLPTITYGFAIIYTFGRQGLLTRALGFQAFDIYGFNGLLMGYVIYTLPTAFLLIDNSFRFIDKRYLIVSRVMGDSPAQTFARTIVRPLAGALCVAFIQSFFLAFTDYGIPTSVGGQYNVTKMNASWETTARLMGDSWIKTILRVVTPNAWPTLLQVFGYYFVSSMVTISAVVFLTSARTMVVTTKISALQHVADFDSIFALSLAILVLNLGVKGITALLTQASGARTARKSIRMRGTGRSDVTVAARLLGHPDRVSNRGLAAAAAGVALILAISVFAGAGGAGVGGAAAGGSPAGGGGAASSAGSGGSQVIIYSNADQEALDAYRTALDKNGYAGDYIIQAFGTSELSGKLAAEGSAIEADVITMSSYYIDSAQANSHMFADLVQVQSTPLDTATPAWRAPVQAQEGAIFYNTQVLASEGLPVPGSFKDLADPVYRGMVSVPDISGSSTGWLMIQAIMDAYGDEEGTEILTGIYRNAGPYLSQSGSAPIKNVRAGEVAIGFGLRHQALSDRASGLPIEVVEPREGTYSLTESVAVVDHNEGVNPLAQEIAAVIVDSGRKRLMNTYPKPLYQGEAPRENSSSNPKEWPDALTVPLLEIHKEVSERCRRAAAE